MTCKSWSRRACKDVYPQSWNIKRDKILRHFTILEDRKVK